MKPHLKEFIWMIISASVALFAIWKTGHVQLVVLLWLTACIGAIVGIIRQQQ